MYSRRLMNRRTSLVVLLCACGCGLMTGCSVEQTRFDITDYKPDGQEPDRYFETFDDVWYRHDSHGRLEMSGSRTDRIKETGEDVTRSFIIQGIWRADPGNTIANTTQINAKVTYWITGKRWAISWQGAGFISYGEDYNSDSISGELELSTLSPGQKKGAPPILFERVEMSGEFTAEHHPRRAVRMIRELEKTFGPPPRYEPPPPGPL